MSGTPIESYDLVVLGAGPAGEKGAAQAAYFGNRVAVVERAGYVGGTGINVGGVPSKTLRETALYFSGLGTRGLYGVDYTVKRGLTVQDFMFRQHEVSPRTSIGTGSRWSAAPPPSRTRTRSGSAGTASPTACSGAGSS
jgi:NAD(P) transhydrogenase